jgi:predicted adenine nucleotide alpha hydrolase (AANH) superfamily ATPase
MNILKDLLLHVCCAPCSGGIIETLLEEGTRPTLYFYNPNIHPFDEYERRKAAIKEFAQKTGLAWADADYEPDQWLTRVKGLEDAPERGLRCQACFDIRLERTALYAHENGFKIMGTTNGISRWKDINQVRKSGMRAVAPYPGIAFLDRDWRKSGGIERMNLVTKRENFYQQTYCGCIFSNKKAM